MVTDAESIKALLARGRTLAEAGRLAEAEAVLREALRAARGRGDASESRAAGNLGTFYGIQGRDFEAMLLYRRALAIDRRRGDDLLVVFHLANLATLQADMGLQARLRALLHDADEALDRLGDEHPDRPRALARILFARFEHACWMEDPVAARRHLEDIRREHREAEPRIAAAIDLFEARLHRLEGDRARALAAVERGLATPGLAPASRLPLEAEGLELLEALGERAALPGRAEAALALLEEAAADPQLVAPVIAYGPRLAAVLERAGGSPEAVRRAYDRAASATLERIRQLDACMQDLPELATATREDHGWFAALREAFAREQHDLLGRVASALEEARREGVSPLHDEKGSEGLIRLCAWCCTVRTREGRWLPVAHFIPAEPGVRVTHTICASCAERLRGQRPGGRPLAG